ncbi:AlpA family phage regulatory protein [Salmonella enterica subsp. enterica]|uniref:AlpA family phage regulatory protein n=1 Tax=Enterobacter cloacae TaxID=550 RepID=A0A4Q2E636_ENTCL|nr:AlpA family phage regulatory protein [Citrobacter sp. FDAARGOS_156]EAQ5897852.1 AlpA family phage regulatory protein [Salmonella enterica]EBP4394095.1 AlpA family phage regulatory protein [Salmonella enterica subsp. enterica]EGI6040714.1 AlpA family phage regulatory protein [Salmonella enterica subsp. enterica serovar Brunei]ELK7554299.1 AlpA family phage regulatory protein [Citrobacter freundii]MBY7250064.1 AlpA family phage regulatory protein [Enterobacter roggenkampii]RXW28750.1 AlpA fa
MGRQLEPTSLIDMRYMMEDSGMGKTFLYAEIKKGNLPQPMKFGRSSRWLLSDYEQWKLSHKTQ